MVEYNIGSDRVKGKIIKLNIRTVIVQAPCGNHIKRHFEKHNVRIL